MIFDLFIPAHPKDFHKLKFLVKSILEFLPDHKEIVFSCPGEYLHLLIDVLKKDQIQDWTSVADESLSIPFDSSRCRHRPNWIKQQYLKMFQNVTSDIYLTVDADCIFLKPMPMFENGKRIIWQGWEQNHRPYFEFQEKMLSLPREFNGTGICDMNFMDRRIIKEILDRNGYTIESFIEKSYEIIGPGCYPAEPEIWIQYAMKYHPDKYTVKQAKVKAIGRDVTDRPDEESGWTDQEIEAAIVEYSKTDLDMIMLHSWKGYNN